jgi:hypothetical protein
MHARALVLLIGRSALSIFGLVGLLAGFEACSAAPSEAIGVDRSSDTGSLGYCRSITCPPPAGYPSENGECAPPDWASSETCRDKEKASGAPLWWRTACVGYDLNQAASRNVTYPEFEQATEGAFAAWTGATCPSEGGSSRASVDVRNLGPIPCARATYDKSGGPNQNVIVFHDDAWPYEASDRAQSGVSPSPVIALTTVTFDPETGELFDADVELNSADHLIAPVTPGAPPTGAYDLQAILTHELGHFFGLAHSPLTDAVMNASGDSDTSTPKRALRLEDVRGICAIYPADGARDVSLLADPSGTVLAGACDPTPHHGFSATCP